MKQPDYIESREGGYWIRGTRVSLDEADDEYEQFRERIRAEYPEAHRRLDAILDEARATR